MPKNWTKAELARKKAREEQKKQMEEANQNPQVILKPLPLNENPEPDFGAPSDETTPPDSFTQRAAAKLSAVNESIQTKRGRPAKVDETGELANLLSSVILIVFAFTTFPEEVKPTGEESAAFALPLAKIIARHIDISGKLTGDALDAVSLLVAGSAWYSRVAPTLRTLREQKKRTQELESHVLNPQDEQMSYARPADIQPITPIQQASPATGSWLDRQATAESQ